MIILIEDPIIPDQIAKIKYNIPISLWLVEYNHLFIGKKVLCLIKVINCKFI